MVLKPVILSSLWLASVALAGFSPSSRLAARLARRHGQSQTSNLDESHGSVHTEIHDDIWAGVVLYGSNNTFTSITGTFTVPTPGTNGDPAAIWVGLDGEGCGKGLLQTGIDVTVTEEGPSFDAWYEWYPDMPYGFPGFDVHAGDVITTNITAYSTTSGIVIFENHTTGQTVNQTLQSTNVLCLAAAEWIVEDFEDVNNEQAPVVNLGDVVFRNAVTAGPGGTYTPCENNGVQMDVMDLELAGKLVTSVVVDSCDINVKYL